MVLLVPFCAYISRDNFVGAAKVFVVSALTDFLDGFFARKLKQTTDFGAMIDPAADKFTVLTVMICVGLKFPRVIPFMAFMAVKETVMIGAGIWLLKIKTRPIKARWYGKLATAFFYFSVSIIIGFKILWDIENEFLIVFLMLVTALLMLFALIKYAVTFFKVKKIFSLGKRANF